MLYPKINTLWKRDPDNKFNIIRGDFSCAEFDNIKRWYVTEKIDGTNIRVMIDFGRGSIIFGGRTDNAQIPPMLMKYLQETFTMDRIRQAFPFTEGSVILFGEGYGAKIQKGGGLYRSDNAFILFDVWIDPWWLEQDNVKDIAEKLGIDHVPFLGIMTYEEVVSILVGKPKSMIAQSDKVVEGFVARSYPLMFFRHGGLIMWKLKVKDYEKLGVIK